MVRKSFGGKCIIRSGIFKRSKASNMFSNSVLTKLKVCVSLYIITWLSNVHWQHLWFLWQYKWTLRLQWIFCGFRDPQTHVAIMSSNWWIEDDIKKNWIISNSTLSLCLRSFPLFCGIFISNPILRGKLAVAKFCGHPAAARGFFPILKFYLLSNKSH